MSISAMGFSYCISLQVRHPDADPDDIIHEIGLPVRRSSKMGEPRSTLRGAPLPGHYDMTFCVFDLGVGADGELADHLRSRIATLIPKREFLHELRATGGSLNLFITWTVGERGEVFDCTLLSDLVSLGIDLGIEPISAD
ncbi:hypothetical protein [Sphingobium sp. AP50]|uniref:hypothetical protein n=1 Tax=Sphingobium sp. AP50 TaxID=1884369 RepID=UPI0011607789|nr:hypothetical protein [Sphingobium sp. AP50]